MQRLEPTFEPAGAEHLPNSHRLANTFHRGQAHVAIVKQPTRKPLRARRNHHCSCVGQCLKPSSEIGRLADDAALLGFALTGEITDYHDPGRNPDPHSQTCAGSGMELADAFDQRQPGTYGPLGIVFVRPGITKISKYTIAHVLGNETTCPGNYIRATPVIGGEDLPHVFWIEPRREGRGADEITEHNGKLPSVSVVAWHGRGCDWRYCNGAVVKLGNRAQHLAAMPKQDAKVLEILVRQIAEDRVINTVLGKDLGILGQTERCQPLHSR